jgi:4-hydroxy-tetrahydrodipicolinate synthase
MEQRTKSLGGLWVALATPFDARGAVDLAAFARLCRHVVAGGADALVVLGSTGEAATLEEHERDALIETAREHRGPAWVVAGTGHNATATTARWTKRAMQLGCDAALVVTPYYNRPMPSGLVQHFAVVADAAPDLPLVAYNVPARTGSNLTPATLARLFENERVVAIKESSGNLAQIGEIARALPPGRTLLAGDDPLALASIAVGAAGLVSVLGNALPGPLARLVAAALRGDMDGARTLHRRLLPVMDAMGIETNPIPVKAALGHLGICEPHCRLPLTTPTKETWERVSAALDATELVHRPRP